MISNDLLMRPAIRLYGKVDDQMLQSFLQQMAIAIDNGGPVLVEVTTTGGDAETGRRIATDIILARERFGLDMVFLGKSVVYSAGISIMSGFPREKRHLTRDCMLLVHERRLDKSLELKGAMRGMRVLVEDTLAEIESALAMERTAFGYLVEGSELSLDELMQRIGQSDWYIPCDEALRLGLVGEVI
jgi:ATP-dependent Clp protease protease subunit